MVRQRPHRGQSRRRTPRADDDVGESRNILRFSGLILLKVMQSIVRRRIASRGSFESHGIELFPRVIARSACDEAIHLALYTGMDCFAALAMTRSNTSFCSQHFRSGSQDEGRAPVVTQ